jgi:SPX domain protein involved in polyphosphate accumulation
VELNTEIEKVSLFTLKRQGELAEGVGALRFDAYAYCEPSGLLFQGDALFKNLVSNVSSLPSSSSSEEDKWNVYSFVGVELLHLLRFICVNAMGIRKILKKHDNLQRNDNEIMSKEETHGCNEVLYCWTRSFKFGPGFVIGPQ